MSKGVFFFLILYGLSTLAQGQAQGKTSTLGAKKDAQGKGQVLDFEGEVIEGERKRPDLFLQISTKDLNFDSLLYLRNNFNDYLEIDRKGRNRYFKVKGK